MEKKCLVIMPATEPDGYAQGHFGRVYDYIIVPACRMAGFSPIKADDTIASSNIALETLKSIIESDIAICDLSAKDSGALRALAIRQALSLPVTLIKDVKTGSISEVIEFGPIEYDDSLRIDTVQKATQTLIESLNSTLANKGQMNSLLSRLNLGPGQIQVPAYTVYNLDDSGESNEPSEPKEAPLPIISPLPDYVGNPLSETDIEKMNKGDIIFHMNHGRGEISTLKKMGKDKIANIQFESGTKILVLGTSGFFRKVKKE